MYGFENQPNIINADDIWFQDVARGIFPSYEGVKNAFGVESVKEGDHLTYNYSLDMPETVLKKENTELVVLLLNEDGMIINADKCAIEGTILNRTDSITRSVTTDPYYYTCLLYTSTARRIVSSKLLASRKQRSAIGTVSWQVPSKWPSAPIFITSLSEGIS